MDAVKVNGEYPQWECRTAAGSRACRPTYEAVIRVNSQSGKGGVAYIMETEHQLVLPRRLQIEFSKAVQAVTEDTGTEISPAAMWDVFEREYFPADAPVALLDHELRTDAEHAEITAQLRVRGGFVTVHAAGNGPSTPSCTRCVTARHRDRRRGLQRTHPRPRSDASTVAC
jgi:hypothetical protein